MTPERTGNQVLSALTSTSGSLDVHAPAGPWAGAASVKITLRLERDTALRYPASRELAAHLPQFRLLGRAAIDRERAAGPELASLRQARHVGRRALDRLEPAAHFGVEPRDRAEQRPGVRVLRVVEDVFSAALLDDPTCIHDDDAVAHAGDDPEVVCDQDRRGSEFAV